MSEWVRDVGFVIGSKFGRLFLVRVTLDEGLCGYVELLKGSGILGYISKFAIGSGLSGDSSKGLNAIVLGSLGEFRRAEIGNARLFRYFF